MSTFCLLSPWNHHQLVGPDGLGLRIGALVCIPRSLTDRRVSTDVDPTEECVIICAFGGSSAESLSDIDCVVLESRRSSPEDREATGSVDRVKLSRKGGGRDSARDA